MKALVCTDMHGSKKALEKIKELAFSQQPDILLCCGDISIFEVKLSTIFNQLAELNIPLFIVHGNHEDDEPMKKECSKLDHTYAVHNNPVVFDDTLFLGYGGDGFSMIDPEFEEMAKKFVSVIQEKSCSKVVFLSHAPPFDTKLDLLMEGHCGNKAIRAFLEKNLVDYAFCGHIHENFDKEDKIGKTVIMNPGPFGKIVDL